MLPGRRTLSLCAVLSALLLTPSVTGQVAASASTLASSQPFRRGGGESSLPAGETIVKEVDEVNLVFTVRDHKGRFVSDLTGDEIQVLDDRRAPESVRYFQQQTDLPLRVGLLIDISGSVFSHFAFEQKAAIAFLRKVLRPSSDAALVAGFDASFHTAQELTNDPSLLAQGVKSLRPSGETALYDAVRHACKKLAQTQGQFLSRRVIILFTDGMDNRSQATLSEAIETALRSEVVVYAISVNPPDTDFNRPGEEALRGLAQATGGRVLPAQSPRQASKAFASIQKELRSQYALGYRPVELKPDGRYRSIQLTARHSGKLRVHVRQGYFAPREAPPQPVSGP